MRKNGKQVILARRVTKGTSNHQRGEQREFKPHMEGGGLGLEATKRTLDAYRQGGGRAGTSERGGHVQEEQDEQTSEAPAEQSRWQKGGCKANDDQKEGSQEDDDQNEDVLVLVLEELANQERDGGKWRGGRTAKGSLFRTRQSGCLRRDGMGEAAITWTPKPGRASLRTAMASMRARAWLRADMATTALSFPFSAAQMEGSCAGISRLPLSRPVLQFGKGLRKLCSFGT